MIRQYLYPTLRNLWQHRLSAFVSILSLCIGLTVFNFSVVYVKRELSYNRGWTDADRIHRLIIEQNGIPGRPDGIYTNSLARNYPNLQNYFESEIEASTRSLNTIVGPADSNGQYIYQLSLVDSEFLNIFKPELIAGSLERTLTEPGLIALEESQAVQLVGDNPVGKLLTLEYPFSSSGMNPMTFEVAAVYSLPEPISSSVRFYMLAMIDDSLRPLLGNLPWENSHNIWLKLKPGVSTEAFNAQQADFLDSSITAYNDMLQPGESISDFLQFRFQALTDMHLHPIPSEEQLAGNATRMITFGVISILVLLAGCSNTVSLSLSRAFDRQKETGIRKAIGAEPRQISTQFLSEALLLALIACLPALLFHHLLQPVLSAQLAIRPALETGMGDYLLLTGIAGIIGLVNGIWPALRMSSLKPCVLLYSAAKQSNSRGWNVRNLLVSVQFCFAQILLIATAVVVMQFAMLRNQPLGFNAENLVFLAPTTDQERAVAAPILEALKQLPGIDEVFNSDFLPPSATASNSQNIGLINRRVDETEIKHQVTSIVPGFFEAFEIPVIAGRSFDRTRDAAMNNNQNTDQEDRIILNRSATRALGFDSPDSAIDSIVIRRNASGEGVASEYPAQIIGVVEDSRLQSMRNRPGPEVYIYRESYGGGMIVRFNDLPYSEFAASVRQTWQEISGTELRLMQDYNQNIDDAFRQERNESRLLQISAWFTLLLSCIGLYGLASSIMQSNIKEVGIRKALGASVTSLIQLYLWRFSIPILLTNIVAWPVALYFVLQWLTRFPYQLDKIWLLPISLAATIVVWLIAMLTVGKLTAKAASAKPVMSLRYE